MHTNTIVGVRHDKISRPGGSTIVFFGLALLVGIAFARIVATYHVFNQTYDEPYHVAAGIEWWDLGRYQWERKQPPLPRIAIGLAPYLDGLHSLGHEYTDDGFLDEGNAILYSRNTYQRNLTLARMGTLPFLIIASVIVWIWSDRIFGRPAAWVATLLFTTLPPILAHAGLATTDMATTAFFAVALYTFTLWMEHPGRWQTAALGAGLGLSLLSKITFFLFIPACALALMVLYWAVERPPGGSIRKALRKRSGVAVGAVVIALLVTWAGYRFSLTRPLKATGQSQRMIDRNFGTHGILHDWMSKICNTPVPLGEVLAGLGSNLDVIEDGHPAYLLGAYSRKGWWYFFPVVLAVKTPLAFLILLGIGIVFLARRAREKIVWQQWAPIYCAVSILVVCLPSTIVGGVRYILPIYPMLAIIAGFGAASLLTSASRRRIAASLGVLLLAWQVVSSAAAHPDYLSYFNEIGAREPERIIVDNDLDWGQDLNRLSEKLRELGTKEVALSYFGTADIARHGLPAVRPLVPYQPTTGWVAISLYNLKLRGLSLKEKMGKPDSPWAWLQVYKPVATVGKSIRLYYVPPQSSAAPIR